MAIITVELDPNEPLTEEQMKELEALKDRPIMLLLASVVHELL